jgi:hypothetical protein
MTGNVINIADFRRPEARKPDEEQQPTAKDIAGMPYAAVLEWAGADFNRLVAVAKIRDYRPEWISHQLLDRGFELTRPQAAIMAQLIATAGPYLSRRERWVMRHIKAEPMCAEALAKLAKGSVEFRGYKDLARCIENDIRKLAQRGLIQLRTDLAVEHGVTPGNVSGA